MVEYALLVAVIAVLSIPALAMAGHETEKTMTTVAETLAADSGGGPVSGAPSGTEDERDAGNDAPGDPGNGGIDNPGGRSPDPGPGGSGDVGNDSDTGSVTDPSHAGDDSTWAVGSSTSHVTDRKGNSKTYDWTATVPLVNNGDEVVTFQVTIIEIKHNGRSEVQTVNVSVGPGETADLQHTAKVQINSGSAKQTTAIEFQFGAVLGADGTPLPGSVPAPLIVGYPPLP